MSAHSTETARHDIVEKFMGLGQRPTAHCSCGWYGSGSTRAERDAVIAAHIDGSGADES